MPARKTAATAAPAKKRPCRTGSAASPPLPLAKKLVLQKWVLHLFQAKDLADLCDAAFRHPDAERLNSDGVTEFHRHLTNQTYERSELPHAVLLRYDENIVRHTRTLNYHRESRGVPVRWKFFQYIALLFTEIYLDRWFRDADGLRNDLNAFLDGWNRRNNPADQLAPWTADDLRKLAFWQATGSGKSLILHANILQYRHYAEAAGLLRNLNRIILLTPNEGLSRQHLEELQLSGLQGELFDKDAVRTGQGLMFQQQTIEIIDINKLGTESKEKTVAVDAFEGNNLVLVDEGHRGVKADGITLEYRNQLSANGFSFEYSATFSQALSTNPKLAASYAKWILFDYSYSFFHADGYGKDFKIFNLRENNDEGQQELYLTAAVLSFYQQLRLWLDQQEAFGEFQIERPLWVFFGGKVNAEESDIADVLLFLARFVKDEKTATRRIDQLLSGKDGLLSQSGQQVFARAYDYLTTRRKLTAQEVWKDILTIVLNAPAGGILHVRNLKSAAGELSLSIGSSAEPFGVVNVGEEKKLAERCGGHPGLIAIEDQDFGASLFRNLNDKASKVHVLLGSRKFTEGWNSWRVSSIGLMKLGVTEGPTVIQLFGRGVRLKGWQTTLKRSAWLHKNNLVKAPDYLHVVETLGVFGVKANYMEEFRNILNQEGVKTGEEWTSVSIKPIPTLKDIPSKKLKIVRLKEGLNFRRDGGNPRLTLSPVRKHLKQRPVPLDWYPRLEAMASNTDRKLAPVKTSKARGFLTRRHTAFLDTEKLYLGLQELKNERGWHNMSLPRESFMELLSDQDWYCLLIPPQELEFSDFGKRLSIWQRIAAALLAGYCDRFYKFHQQAWESKHSEVITLEPEDPNLDLLQPESDGYQFSVDPTEQALLEQLQSLAAEVAEGKLKGVGVESFWWDGHLYKPLFRLTAGSASVQVSPAALNKGEWQFLQDLKKWHGENPAFFEDRELYVLRNRSRKGIGFFEAGNFYPDFILWLLDGDTQHVAFVDPKGIRFSEGWSDLKITFHEEIKKLEERLGEPGIHLHSFILSASAFQELLNFGSDAKREDFDAAGVLFLSENTPPYLDRLFQKIIGYP